MNTSNTIDDKYTEAIQSLKKINNELFYDELKDLMKDREKTIAELNEEVYESIENMKKSMNSIPMQVSGQLKEEVMNQQTEMFDRGMERFNENILVLEKKVAFWHQQYQEYLEKTEKMLADAKGFQQEDQMFIVGESERVLTSIRLLKEQLTEHASALNVKYEAVSDRLGMVLHEIKCAEDRNKAEIMQLRDQVVRIQRDIQEELELSAESSERRDGQFKKWLIGLAVGQGVSVLLMILLFLLK